MRLLTSILVLAVCAAAAPWIHAEDPALDSDDDKILYTLGIAMSRSLTMLELSDAELRVVQAGLADGARGRDPRVPPETFGPRIQSMMQARLGKVTEREKEAGAAFRAEMSKEPDAVTTDSGMIYRELEAGAGPSPVSTDSVKLHYHGTLRDGSVFDSSLERDPATFSLGGVIGCFGEGVQMMKVGGKSKLTCPPEIAYGDQGAPPKIRPGATLVFEVQLLEIVGAPETAPVAP